MFWVVRADGFWYRFDDKTKAQEHYNFIFNNKDGKYKQIERIYLAEYGGERPKILEMWNRPQQEEEFGYGK